MNYNFKQLISSVPWVLSRVYTRAHRSISGYKLYPFVSTCCRQHVSCIGNKIVATKLLPVASLSPVCCWIQRDTGRPWHKWIVIMSPRYSQHVSRTNNLYWTTCIRQHHCAVPKGSKRHFWPFSLFTDYDIPPNYASSLKFLEVSCTPKWCFLTFKHFYERI